MSDTSMLELFTKMLQWASERPSDTSAYALVRYFFELSRDFDFNLSIELASCPELLKRIDALAGPYATEPLLMIWWSQDNLCWNLWLRGYNDPRLLGSNVYYRRWRPEPHTLPPPDHPYWTFDLGDYVVWNDANGEPRDGVIRVIAPLRDSWLASIEVEDDPSHMHCQPIENLEIAP